MFMVADVLQRVRFIVRLFERTDQPVCDKYGLSKLEVDVLAFLKNNPGLDTARDIVELRMLPKANVSMAVESLIQKGLLTRQQDHQDRRRIHLALTLLGDGVLPDIMAARQTYGAALFMGFSEEERATFDAMMGRIADNARFYLEGSE